MAPCSESTGTSSAPALERARWTTGAPATSDSLFARASRRPCPQRRDRHPEAGEADDGVQDHVGGLHERGQRSRTGPQLDAGRQQLGEPSFERAVGDRDDLGAELLCLGGKELDRPGRPERADDEAVRGRPEHLEGLGADRAGRTDDGDPPARAVSTPGSGRPGPASAGP